LKNYHLYILYTFCGLLAGFIFPIIFILLDLNQFGLSYTIEDMTDVITSQRLHMFSLFGFPILFATIGYLLSSNKVKKAKIEKNNNYIIQSEKFASLGILAAGVGHEINNPLAIIKGNIDILKRKLDPLKENLNFDLDRRLGVVNESIVRIANIVDGMRTMARSDTQHLSPIDVHEYLEKTVSLVKEIYKKNNINVTTDYNAKSVFIQGNQGKLQQIIMNFLSNAKDAMEVNGSGTISVSTQNEKNNIVLKFTDDGSGISEDHLEKIFDTFFTTKEVGKGTGMGLSISISLINEMQGKIFVDSKIGVGTTFKIEFPNINHEKKEVESVDRKFVKNKLKGEVLIVDD
jgi:signal transduction histidine kinase